MAVQHLLSHSCFEEQEVLKPTKQRYLFTSKKPPAPSPLAAETEQQMISAAVSHLGWPTQGAKSWEGEWGEGRREAESLNRRAMGNKN